MDINSSAWGLNWKITWKKGNPEITLNPIHY